MKREAQGKSDSIIMRLAGSEHAWPALGLVMLALAVRLIPAFLVYGSFDVGGWILVTREFRAGHNPYLTGKLNWPPLWPLLLLYSLRLQDAYDLPPHFAVKIIPCVVDSVIAVVFYGWYVSRGDRPNSAFRRSLWYTLNPVAIATCALQGQFESLPSLFSLLAIMQASLSRAEQISWSSAWWLSLGGLAKTWPLFLTPAFLGEIRGGFRRALFLAATVLPTVLSIGFLALFEPNAILKNVVQYRGASGQWGLTAWNYLLPAAAAKLWSHACLWILYCAWASIYMLTWRKGTTAQAASLGILTFYVFTSACGPQHHAWILAIGLLADGPRARWHLLVATITIGAMYLFSPYNGELFNFVRHQHTPSFWTSNMNRHHMEAAALVNLPLWCYCVWWWKSLLRDILRQTKAIVTVERPLVHATAG